MLKGAQSAGSSCRRCWKEAQPRTRSHALYSDAPSPARSSCRRCWKDARLRRMSHSARLPLFSTLCVHAHRSARGAPLRPNWARWMPANPTHSRTHAGTQAGRRTHQPSLVQSRVDLKQLRICCGRTVFSMESSGPFSNPAHPRRSSMPAGKVGSRRGSTQQSQRRARTQHCPHSRGPHRALVRSRTVTAGWDGCVRNTHLFARVARQLTEHVPCCSRARLEAVNTSES